MRKNVDYNLLVQAERIRFQSDFSSAHWLHQVLSMYEQGMKNERRRLAFEAVIRVAINFGCVAAKELMQTYPAAAGFPTPIPLEEPSNWKETQRRVLDHFRQHEFDRFRYVREGD